MKKLLADYNLSDLTEIVKSFGEPAYRAKQLYSWVMRGAEFNEMSNLPKEFLAKLDGQYISKAAQIIKVLESSDGSKKILFSFSDGETAEGVFLPNAYGNTLCVSTQVGCRMRCAFCASGLGGLLRNLSAGEILSQFILAEKLVDKETGEGGNINKSVVSSRRNISNIVLMGSGEPLDNYDSTLKFIRLVSAPEGINVSTRNISLSTCGLVPEILRLADESLGITLSLSLHATTDEVRKKLMPIANKYQISELFSALKSYFNKTGRRIAIEYALIKGVNSSVDDVKRLTELIKNLPCHINLIQLNSVKESNLHQLSGKEANSFLKQLLDLGVSATLRRSYGSDIAGACGQLRAKYVVDKQP